MTDKPTQEQYDAWTDDPSNWRYQFFYFNPKDKRIMPPKRNRQLGWTINFGNTLSILVFAAIILVTIIIFILADKFEPTS